MRRKSGARRSKNKALHRQPWAGGGLRHRGRQASYSRLAGPFKRGQQQEGQQYLGEQHLGQQRCCNKRFQCLEVFADRRSAEVGSVGRTLDQVQDNLGVLLGIM